MDGFMSILKVILCLLFSLSVYAQEQVIVPIGSATLKKTPLNFIFTNKDKLNPRLIKLQRSFQKILLNDFLFYKKKFNVQTVAARRTEDVLGSFFIETSFKEFEGDLSVETKLYQDGSVLSGHTEVAIVEDVKELSKSTHRIADAIYQKVTGKKSIFKSRIAFVSDIGSRKNDFIKELFIMDFDGRNMKRVTKHKGIVISPSLSRDGTKVLYSLIGRKLGRSGRRVNLRMYDFVTKKDRLVSSRKGVNSGAVFTDDGQSILLTLTFMGNAEIYKMDLKTGKIIQRLTKNFANDVDPNVTANGSRMAFLSDRSGKAHIYTLDLAATEKDVKRVSFVGKFNATPRYSPDGKMITFSSWPLNSFDIYRVNTDGSNLVRLTSHFGSNEDPSFSPDNNFIVFSSQRVISRKKAETNIYIMDIDGNILGSITKNMGNCITPTWSN
jgi:TolB protein